MKRARFAGRANRMLPFRAAFVVAMLFPACTAFGQGGAPVATDSFNRADSSTLGLADTGQAWTIHQGTIGINAETAKLGSAFVLASLDTATAQGTAAVRVVAPADEFWLVVRMEDDANYWRFGRWRGEPYQLQQVRANALASPQIQTSATVSPQAADLLTCVLLNPGLRCSVNGTVIATTSEPSATAATRVGLSGYLSDNARLDDLRVTGPAPDLTVRLSGPSSSIVGATVSWIATLRNDGGIAIPSAQLQVTPPAGATGLTINGSACSYNGTMYSCLFSSLAPQAQVSVTVSMPALVATSLTISASVPLVAGETDNSQNAASFTTTIQSALPAGVVVADTFERTNGSPLGTADTGQQWVDLFTSTTIAQGQAAPSAGFSLTAVNTGLSANVTSVKVTQIAPEFWLVLRLQDGQNYWRFGRRQNQAYQLQQISQNALASPVVSTLATLNPATGDVLSCKNTQVFLECSVNDVLVTRTTDTAGNTATRVGLSAYQSAATRFDDFLVVQPPVVPELSVTLTGISIANANMVASWTASVRNEGTVTAQTVELALIAPAAISQVVVTGASCVTAGATHHCSLGTLTPGQTVLVRLDAVMPASSGNVTVTGSVPAQSGELQVSDNTASFATYVHNAANGSMLLYDSFDRPDGVTLGVATTGQSWTTHTAGLAINGSQVAAASGFTLASIDAGSATADTSVTLAAPASEFWLVLRLVDSQNYWRFGRTQNQQYQLQQIVQNNLVSPVLTSLATVMAAAGDILNCKTSTQSLECAVNGVPVVRATSTIGSTASRIGLSTYQATGARFDNLMVTELPPAPDLSVALVGPSLAYGNTLTTWTATVRNLATIAAQSFEVTFTAPSISQGFITGASCAASGSTWRCPIVNLAPGQAVSLTFNGVTPSMTGSVMVSASVPVYPGENEAANNAATVSTHVHHSAGEYLQVFDAFDRPDSTVPGAATTGQAWTVHSGGMRIVNSQAAPTDGFLLASMEAAPSPWFVSLTLRAPAPEFWLVLRMQDTQNYWRFGRTQNQAYLLQQVLQNNLGSPVLTTLATVMPAAGDIISCQSTAQLLECAVNGAPVVRTSATAGGTATRLGISAYQSSAARFDDFRVTRPPLPPDVSVSLTGTALVSGTNVGTWTATIQNQSSVPAAALEAVLAIPSSITQVAITGSTCTANGMTWRCQLGTLSPGQVVSLQIAGTPSSTSGYVALTVSVAAQAGESQVANNSAAFSTYVHSATAGVLRVYDAFNRPDASTLGLATTAQTWTVHTGSFGISNGQAAPGYSFALASLDAGSVPVNVSVSLAGTAPEFWLLLRYEDTQNYWRFGRWNDGPYQLQLVRAGVIGAAIVNTLATVIPVQGDSLSCSVAVGITCAVNGSPVLTTTDATGQAATRVGLSSNGSTTRFEDLLVVVPPPAPNLTVQVNAPRHVLVNQAHTAEVLVRNVGQSSSASGTLIVTVPAWMAVVSRPAECAPQNGVFSCPVPTLAVSATRQFLFTFRGAEIAPFTARAEVSAPGDSFYDNVATWGTWIHTAGSVIDAFERSNTPAGLGISSTQHVWTSLSPGFRISNGQAQTDTAGALAVVSPGYAFGTMEVVLGTNASTTGIVFRVANANNYYRLAADESGYYALRKIVNGVPQTLALGIVRASLKPAAGDLVRLMTRPDDGVFVAVNGQQILDFGDPESMLESGWGIVSVGGPASVQDFAVEPRLVGYATLDNFDQPDGSQLRQPTSGSKYQWRPWLGTPWVTLSGRAKPTAIDYTYTWVDTASELANVAVTLSQLGQGAWVIFRYDEFADTYFRFGPQGGTYTVQFMNHWDVGIMPVPVQTLSSPTPQSGDVLGIRQKADGTVECSVNGVITHRFVDSATNARWTLYGLAAQGSLASFDDFQVLPFSR